ncbi:MAG TPA: hypothetical protein VEC11_14075 [Allosphingosinicella sp.]|nr:hypothetical protein [Allosphingosinicella sp.]
MSDRWDDEDDLERGRDRLRGRGRVREPEPEPTLGEVIDGAVRKIVTGIVIAGGLIGLGVYSSGGGDPSVDYQIATTPDGIVYRLTSESGRIIACRGNHCWEMLERGQDLEDGPPAVQPPQNAAAAQPAQPQAVTAQPAPAQLPAPQNEQAPATR